MRSFIGAVLILVAPAIGVGHHSDFEYDRNSRTEIFGEVTAVLWRNPHVVLTVESSTDGTWTLEGDNPNLLARFGVPRDAVAVGDQVRIAGYPSTRRGNRLWFSTIYRGEEFILTDDYSAGESGFSEESIDASIERANGLFRVWGWFEAAVNWPDELPLREAAEVARASWDIEDDPSLDCTAPGMPRAISHNPFPIEFVEQEGDAIRLYLTEFDAFRTIYMNGEQPADEFPATPLGFSIGELDNGVLVVRTTKINYPLFDRTGTPQSEEVEMVETFRLSDDETRLDYEITVDDPITFTEPVTGTRSWAWLPGRERMEYDAACSTE